MVNDQSYGYKKERHIEFLLVLYFKVAHSMGGLLTKYILTNEENEELRSNTRACVFFSVPHFGAELGLLKISYYLI